jgi:Ca2+-binding EF-hand superfamily protein
MASASDEVILSEEEIEALTLAFNQYDLDRSGEIDRYEFKAALTAMGNAKITDDDIDELMTAVDEDKSGAISFVEFLKMVKMQKEIALSRDAEADMLDAFCALGGNADKTGHVSRKHLVHTIKVEFELPIDIEDMIDALDADGSGEIEWPEFERLFTKAGVGPNAEQNF